MIAYSGFNNGKIKIMTKLYFILTFVLFAAVNYTQGQDFSGDLKNAKKVEVNKLYKFSKTPNGYGSLKEFKLNQLRPPTIFKEERNTTWFLIEAPYEGVLTFEITPHRNKDDYDWMLYSYTSTLSKEILSDKATPLRTNNSNNKLGLSKTGLKGGIETVFSPPGAGSSYSKPLNLKKGEKLVLVIDNIYKKGQGFNLLTRIIPVFKPPFIIIEGYVRSKKTNLPLAAQVLFEDDTSGAAIIKVNSDPITGYYKAFVPVRSLNGVAKRVGYLLTLHNVIIKKAEKTQLDFFLDTIVPGQKLVLYNIHFSPNSDQFLETSKPELHRLLEFLKEQPDWQIKIVGHTNFNAFANARYLQTLSFNRALSVKKYLLENSIPEKRMSCAGLGGNNPLFNTKDPIEGLKNLRVEVILSQKNRQQIISETKLQKVNVSR